MQMPVNSFKQALREGRPQIGLWLGLADPYVAELLATTGYDWLLIDAEHAPNDVRSVRAQLQAVAPYASHAIVRPPVGDAVLIKQLIDTGAQTLLIPMVDSAERAGREPNASEPRLRGSLRPGSIQAGGPMRQPVLRRTRRSPHSP
jgi:4-hydroxy-2-oxoheptanedioate aldolase